MKKNIIKVKNNNMVNILISTYNGEKYVLDQLNSIEGQTYTDFHVYIRDDGSTDCTVQIVNDYIQRNNLIQKYTVICGENIGFVKSFYELLITASSGKYWAFCDQDDYWYPTKLENAVKWLEQANDNIPLLYQSRVEVGNEDLTHKKAWDLYDFEYCFKNAFTTNIFFGFAMVINKPLYDKLIKADFNNIKYHDWFVSIIVSAFGTYHLSDSIEAIHRVHKKNTSPTSFLKKIPDGIRLLKGDNFYRNNAKEFWRLYEKELSGEKRDFCEMFLNPERLIKNNIRKAFMFIRWNPRFEIELILRCLMLIGRI